MYKHGDLKKLDAPCETLDEDGDCLRSYLDGHDHAITDNRGENQRYHGVRHPAVYLPHSCDYWIIGGPEEIKQLISDLQEALKH
ncbi:MAG: hypothetical protein V3U75_01220 [Methylococcaceae bacterium]